MTEKLGVFELGVVTEGDCLEHLKKLPDASVDSVVTDPPAGIGFMGKSWDDFGRVTERTQAKATGILDMPPGRGGKPEDVRKFRARAKLAFIAAMTPIFEECLRVLKPGGHALVWAIPRTSHWTATALENAGFEVRDRIAHLYSQGFPKSHSVAGAIDKACGCPDRGRAVPVASTHLPVGRYVEEKLTGNPVGPYDPKTDEAKKWDGWGTALKPACEDWWLCRKPLESTVAANVLKHGTGAINVDGCRIEHASEADRASATPQGRVTGKVGALAGGTQNDRERTEFARPDTSLGRWPANLVLSCGCGEDHEFDCPVQMLDEQSGQSETKRIEKPSDCGGNTWGGTIQVNRGARGHTDAGGASRFFYTAKATKDERNASGRATNKHATVKPVNLMRYLCRLITPPNGVVLDPFAGSGTTGVAAKLEGFRFLGFDKEPEYVQTANARIAAAKEDAGELAKTEAKKGQQIGLLAGLEEKK